MILWLFDLPKAEARKSSMISPNRGDLFRYLNFHLAQSVAAGALLASSVNSISLITKLASLLALEGTENGEILFVGCQISLAAQGFFA